MIDNGVTFNRAYYVRYKATFFLLLSVVFSLVILLNNYEWDISGNTFNLERLFALPLTVLAILVILVRQKFPRLKQAPILLLVWLIIALISSMLSAVPAWSLKMFLLQCVAVSYYFMIIVFRPDPVSFFESRYFLVLAWFFGPIVSILYLFNVLDYDLPQFFQHFFQEGSGGTRIRATILEANLFGAFLTLMILAVIAMKRYNKIWWWALLFGLHSALIFSFSRAPLGAYFIALMVYLFVSAGHRYTVQRLVKIITRIFGLIILFSITAYIIYLYYGDHEIIGRVHSVQTRLIMWALAFEDILRYPLLGNGIYSFSAIHPDAPYLVGSDTHRSAWVSNIFLAVLHDTGFVGLILFTLFLYYSIANGWRITRQLTLNGNASNRSRLAAAVFSTMISLIISGQTIPAHSLALFWVIFGLCEQFKRTDSSSDLYIGNNK